MADAITTEQAEAAASDTESPTLTAQKEQTAAEERAEARLIKMASDVDEDAPLTDEPSADDSSADELPVDADKAEGSEESEVSSPITAGQRRAAIARSWTDDEITAYCEDNPDKAVAFFQDVYDKWNTENSEFAARGRALRSERGKEATEPEAPATLQRFDAESSDEESGGEEMSPTRVKQFNLMVDQVNAVTAKLAASEKFVKDQEIAVVQQVADTFLASKEMEPYRELYGVGVDSPTDEQNKKYLDLHEEADNQIAGAAAYGKTLTIEDAFQRANVILTHDSQTSVVLQQVRDSIKKRTLVTPSSHEQMSSPDDNRSPSEDELTDRVSARLREMHNGT